MVEINFVIGLIGMTLILIGFFLDEFYKKFDSSTVSYNLINIFGAGALIYYSYSIQGWPFLILNTVWLIVASVKLIKIIK